MKKTIPFLLLLLCCTTLAGQNHFKTGLLQTNPVKGKNTSDNVAIPAHKAFLEKAIATKNDLHHLYALLYLYKDYSLKADFVRAAHYSFEAQKLAKASGKPGWIGSVMIYTATITGSIEENQKLAITQFKSAIQKCSAAKDSLCMAEGYERLATTYHALGDYKKSHYYYKLCTPLTRKFGNDEGLSVIYNNYANLLCSEKDFKTAIIYIDSAIAVAVKNKNLHSELVFRANMGATYLDLKDYAKALAVFDYCEPINRNNKWTDNLVNNYIGKAVTYEKQGRYKEALEYLNKHNSLKEAITGKKVKSQISGLEKKYKEEEYQLILKKKELELIRSRYTKETYAWLSFSMLLTLTIGLWIWRRQNLRNKKENSENQKSLSELTNLLITKNALLFEMEEELITKNTLEKVQSNDELESALYNQRILTDTDWATFKMYFEKVHPSYIRKVRDSYPTMTDAEKRLFLCIKINLKNKEIASMLGISNDSVKKNRNRLRKRLNLSEKEDLETFIRDFGKK